MLTIVAAMLTVAPVSLWCRPLDKTGTCRSELAAVSVKVVGTQGFSEACSIKAEREGFEPSLPLRVN